MVSVSQESVSQTKDQSGGAIGVTLQGVSKSFGDVHAVVSLDLEVRPGEFFAMLGPSGSGKTTVLRLIAGFERADTGQIFLGDQNVTSPPPYERPVNTVFQDYALFPHMSVAENVGYGLRTRKVPKAVIATKVAEALERIQLPGVAARMPHQLSGGQRQRIALARALILEPRVLLLDEPLGALDKQLREEMQFELKRIQRDLGITFIFVTHDQEEALTLSDRIAVFNAGHVEQVGTPAEVYENPRTRFVASFLGLSNLIPADISKSLVGVDEMISIRPERVRLVAIDHVASAEETVVSGVITETVYTGSSTRYILKSSNGLSLIASRQNEHDSAHESHFERGQPAQALWRTDQISVIPHSHSVTRA
jgi:putative spermidine/putrescine transport system ATP-binding protein